jgi:uridine kinase
VDRATLLRQLASQIRSVTVNHPVRVAIDGPDAAGKTTIADELDEILSQTGRKVIRASIDGFHNPKSIRYQRGSLSPAGYFLDSFNYNALVTTLLTPLGPGGSRRYRPFVFDHVADKPTTTPEQIASTDAILLFDGIFLLRPLLRPYWDFSLFLHVTAQQTLERAIQRDASLLGGRENVRKRYMTRYLPAQEMYVTEHHPHEVASIVIDNENPETPYLHLENTR